MMTAINLATLFDYELHSDLKTVLITKDKTGKYTLFGRYSIRPVSNNLYIVADASSSEIVEFTILKNAIAWCTLRNSKKWTDARRLQRLDLKLCSLNADMAVHKRMFKLAKTSVSRLIYQSKLQEDSYKRRLVISEIESVIFHTRLIQERNFNLAKDHNSNYRDKY